jgi:hypothetical protein
VGSSRRKYSLNAEPRADYFLNFSCSKAIIKHQNHRNFLKKNKLCVILGGYLLGITWKRTMENGMPVPVGYLFSEMPHENLHFVNVPPNTVRKILEAFTVVMNNCRGPNWGCGWTCSGLFSNLLRFSQSYGTCLHLLHANGMHELWGRFGVGYKISITNKVAGLSVLFKHPFFSPSWVG